MVQTKRYGPYNVIFFIDQYEGVPLPEYYDIGKAFSPMSGYSKRYLPVKRSYHFCHSHANKPQFNRFVSNRTRFESFQYGLNPYFSLFRRRCLTAWLSKQMKVLWCLFKFNKNVVARKTRRNKIEKNSNNHWAFLVDFME